MRLKRQRTINVWTDEGMGGSEGMKESQGTWFMRDDPYSPYSLSFLYLLPFLPSQITFYFPVPFEPHNTLEKEEENVSVLEVCPFILINTISNLTEC